MSTDALREQIIEACKQVHDPEIPVNIYDLGLIYKIDIADDGAVHIDMTLTTPACPVAGILPLQVETKVKTLDGVTSARVDIVWDPPWTQDMMSDAARLALNLDAPAPKREPGQKFVGLRTPDQR